TGTPGRYLHCGLRPGCPRSPEVGAAPRPAGDHGEYCQPLRSTGLPLTGPAGVVRAPDGGGLHSLSRPLHCDDAAPARRLHGRNPHSTVVLQMKRVIVVGSGASGVHFALSALGKGHMVTMLDVGRSRSPAVGGGASFAELKQRLPDPTRYFLGENYEA